MINTARIRRGLANTSLSVCTQPWIATAETLLRQRSHGDTTNWVQAIDALPEVKVDRVNLSADAIEVSADSHVSDNVQQKMTDCLMALHPWRKGPFKLCGVTIDSEWRSNLKWDRIVRSISPLAGRKVLDVGSGNGYYLLRMLGSGATVAMGIDPTQLFLAQFAAINRFIDTNRAFILPMKSDELSLDPVDPAARFDTVFSMGVYYHRRNPVEHLRELHGFLRPGGQLVLETLVVDGGEDRELNPLPRYAQMRNVWSIPSVSRLKRLLEASTFADVSLIDLTVTTCREQRATAWMTFDSLTDFLDPADPGLTIEGYPAPIRACITATRV